MQRPLRSLPGWDLPLDVYDSQIEQTNDAGWGDPRMWTKNIGVPPTGYIYENTKDFWLTRRTLLETYMIGAVCAMTDKHNWVQKLRRHDVRAHWLQEMTTMFKAGIEASSKRYTEGHFRDNDNPERDVQNQLVLDKAVAFVWEEMEKKVEQLAESGFVTMLGLGGADVIKSYSAVSHHLKLKLQRLAEALEASQTTIYWQPGEEKIVRNLIHPSRLPLEYGATRLLEHMTVPLHRAYEYVGLGKRLQIPAPAKFYSSRFQWLPAEVRFSSSGQSHITSPVNGLGFEEHHELYKTLAELIDCIIPLWNQCLPVKRGRDPRRVECGSENETYTIPTTLPEMEYTRQTMHNMCFKTRDPRRWVDEPMDAETQARWEHQYPSCPPPRTYAEFQRQIDETPLIDLRRDFPELQIIVKMSNVYLTPDNPEFKGGMWHVEGLANEHICATAIYYYDLENIASSALSFRVPAVMGRIKTPEHFERGLERVYGTKLTAYGRKSPAVQTLPQTVNREGRLLVFPNVFQHRVPSFRLRDPTKSGHRKILVFWLVNPKKPIISTAKVAPRDNESIAKFVARAMRQKGLSGTVAKRIAGYYQLDNDNDNDEETYRVQKELMKERQSPAAEYGKIDRSYNFCEH